MKNNSNETINGLNKNIEDLNNKIKNSTTEYDTKISENAESLNTSQKNVESLETYQKQIEDLTTELLGKIDILKTDQENIKKSLSGQIEANSSKLEANNGEIMGLKKQFDENNTKNENFIYI